MMTKDEIRKKVEERFLEKSGIDEVEVNFYGGNRFSKSHVEVEVAAMYSIGDDAVTFDDLVFLSELFKTNNINLGSMTKTDGCETCDYGSRASLTVYIKDATFPEE